MNAAETHETVHWESGMRYQLQTTTSCGSSSAGTQHLVVLTEPHVGEPLCGTTSRRRSHRFRDFCDFRARPGQETIADRVTSANSGSKAGPEASMR